MKKISAILLVFTLIFSMCVPSVWAQENSSVEVDVDYVENTIYVTYKSNLEYNTYVNLYMAPAEDVEIFTDFDKAVRIDEAQCDALSDVVFELKFGKDIDTDYYDFFAAPGGKNSAVGYAKNSEPVYIISESEREDILKELNKKSKDDIADYAFEKFAIALCFEEEACPDWKNEYLFDMKSKDYSGAYTTAGQIYLAWGAADAIYNIRNAQSEDLDATIREGADALGIDIKNSDYTEFNKEFVKRYGSRINEESITTVADNKMLFDECLAITAVNERSNSDKAEAFEQYADVLGISSLIDDIKDAGKNKVARHMEGFKADTPEEVKEKIEKVLSALEKDTSDTGSSGGGGGGRGSSGGSVIGSATVSNDLMENKDSENKGIFTDMSDSHWAKVSVESLAAMGILSGYSDGTFKPDKTVTREEFVKMIISAFNIPAQKSDVVFDDVSETFWAAEYIYNAQSNGLVNGISENTFGVGTPISRQDMAVIMNRVIDYKAIAVSSGSVQFADEDEISEYAREAVSRLGGAGIVNGLPNGSFNPFGSLTRAEAAKVIYSMIVQ